MIVDWLLERSLVYRAWQQPFAERKLAPLVDRGEVARARRVLDVGCGPGTNAPHFGHADYLGVDINEEYIKSATRRHGRRFIAADVTTYSANAEGRFDFILVNSLLHHLATPAVLGLLAHLSGLLTADGHVHIVDLVLPVERFSISRALVRADRGDYPRPLEELRVMVGEILDVEVFDPYPLGVGGVTLWNMVYCKGRSHR